MNENRPNLPTYSSRRTNACALLHDDEFRRLVVAAETYISAQAVLMSFLATLGNAVHRGLTRIPQGWQDAITKTVRESLDVAQRVSISQMQNYPGHPSSEKLFAAMTVATELPITTGYRQYPDEYLYETLGLYALPRRRADHRECRRSPPPWRSGW
jgi:hypothetical protein